MPTDAKLMRIEIEAMWSTDARGRLTTTAERNRRPAPHLVIATATDGRSTSIGSGVPDALALQLHRLIDDSVPSTDPSTPPDVIPDCTQLLESAVGPVALACGPSYWVPVPTLYASDADTIRSDAQSRAPSTPPDGANWSEDDWHVLTDGALGPWAMAIAGGRVVSICHSARLSDRAAAAGTWTAPDHRGHGLAAATTAAWSSLFDRTIYDLFYSAAANNHSSQNVARRLNLRLIGWTWQLASARGA